MSGRPKLPVETPREWIRHASEDLGVAEREMRYGDIAFESLGEAEAQEAVGITRRVREMVVARLPLDSGARD